jgi:hypothetical protein
MCFLGMDEKTHRPSDEQHAYNEWLSDGNGVLLEVQNNAADDLEIILVLAEVSRIHPIAFGS